MKVAFGLGFEKWAWSLRRLCRFVDSKALVLEVGSGGNPYPRANVLLDAFETTRQRFFSPLVADRPTVLGLVESLPFRDKAFDFVIASHVLEHSSAPERFLSELERVAHAGYIEVPDALMERLNPYRDHRLEITVRNNALVIRKKASWMEDPELVELYEHRAKHIVAAGTIPRHPFSFHVRHFWENKIAFEVVNPEVDAAWQPPSGDATGLSASSRPGIREHLRDVLRGVMSQRRRNASIDLRALLRCPGCLRSDLVQDAERLRCAGCGTVYPVRNGIAAMNEGRTPG